MFFYFLLWKWTPLKPPSLNDLAIDCFASFSSTIWKKSETDNDLCTSSPQSMTKATREHESQLNGFSVVGQEIETNT